MDLYCTTHNAGPTYGSDPLHMRYLGLSLDEAIAAVGDTFQRYERNARYLKGT